MSCLTAVLSVAVAAQTVCVGSDQTLCTRPMAQGEVAPFAGQLLTPQMALSLGQRAEDCEAKLELSLDKAADDARIEAKLCQDKASASEAAFVTSLKECQGSVEECRDVIRRTSPPWWQSPWFVAPFAAILSGGIVAFATTR